jgi:tetratricopeptide (TPR) repeat protein
MAKQHRKHLRPTPAPAPAKPTGAPAPISTPTPVSTRRRWLFRLGTLVLAPMLLLAGLELCLRLIGFGYPTSFFLRSRVNDQAVYIENQKFSRRFFPPALVRHPQPCLMPAIKSTNTCRIFIFGESAAQGDPEPAFGFARVLEALLREQYPGVKFEVVNVAFTAISSHVIVPIGRDCARRQGDIWIVYMGNNEVVGPYGAGTVFGLQTPGLGLIRISLAFKGTRLGQLANAMWHRWGQSAATPKVWGGMEMFLNQQVPRDDPRMRRVYAHFEKNLQKIIRLGVSSGARVIVSTVASNVKDCAPFASLHRPGLPAAELADWEREYATGIELEKAANWAGALAHFERASKIDNHYADLAYRMGRCLWALGRYGEAKGHYEQARDEDTLRFRADSRINSIIEQAAKAWQGEGVFLVDGAGEIARQSVHGVAGDDLLFEHVHLRFEGNYWLGRALAERIGAIVQPQTRAGEWLGLEESARRLVFTEWDRYQGMELMWKRMQEPPFTHQLDWAERNQRWLEQLNTLRPFTKPYALKRAVAEYRQELARASGDWNLHSNFARLLQTAGDDAGALDEWRRVLRLMPHNPQAHYSLGNLLDSLGRSAEAQAFFREALRLRPEFSEALNGLGLCLVSQGKFAEAVSCYTQAIRFNPDFAEGRVNLGLVLLHLGKTAEAIAQYEEALRLKPNSPSAHINLGKVLSSQGRVPEAAAHYAKAVEFAPEDPIARFNLANALAAQGRRAEALEHYGAAVQFKPDFVEARLNLGLELVRQGKNDEALAQFQEAVRLNPDHADAQFNLGVAYAQQNRLDEAIRHFQGAVRLDPGNAQAKKSLEAAIALKNKGR